MQWKVTLVFLIEMLTSKTISWVFLHNVGWNLNYVLHSSHLYFCESTTGSDLSRVLAFFYTCYINLAIYYLSQHVICLITYLADINLTSVCYNNTVTTVYKMLFKATEAKLSSISATGISGSQSKSTHRTVIVKVLIVSCKTIQKEGVFLHDVQNEGN